MARPCSYTDAVGQKIIDATREGLPLVHAAGAAGVGVRTVYDWLKRGEAEDAPDTDEPLVVFAGLYRSALADYVRDALRGITAARNAELDWKADSWKLSKRCPGEFGDRQVIEHQGSEERPVRHVVDVTSDDLLLALDAFASGLATADDGPGDAGGVPRDPDTGAAGEPRG